MPLKDKEALKEYIRLYRRRWRKENPAKSLSEKRKWRQRHKARIDKEWRDGRKALAEWYILKLLVRYTRRSRQDLAKDKALINKTRKSIIEKRLKRVIRKLQ